MAAPTDPVSLPETGHRIRVSPKVEVRSRQENSTRHVDYHTPLGSIGVAEVITEEMRHLAQAIAPVLEQILAVVVRQIRAQKVQAVAGVIGASPGVPGLNLQLSISAQGRLQTLGEFGDIVVHTNPDGAATPATAIRRRSLARGQQGGRVAVRPLR